MPPASSLSFHRKKGHCARDRSWTKRTRRARGVEALGVPSHLNALLCIAGGGFERLRAMSDAQVTARFGTIRNVFRVQCVGVAPHFEREQFARRVTRRGRRVAVRRDEVRDGVVRLHQAAPQQRAEQLDRRIARRL